MLLQSIEKINQNTLAAIQAFKPGGDTASLIRNPYFGYYNVDIFECPPFAMYTNNDCPRAHDILYLKRFEPQSIKVWARLAKQATGILDIGAQVGVYSLVAASLRPDLPAIHAFEPNPYAYTRLRMHKMVNGFGNIVEHPFALSNSQGYAPFSWFRKPGDPISSGGGLGGGKPGVTETTIVPTDTLDNQAFAHTLGPRGLLKVDVEGAETSVFSGMLNALNQRPDIILETFKPGAANTINGLILPLGYRVYHIEESAGRLVPRPNGLVASEVSSGNFNQFLTTRSDEEVRSLFV